MVRAGDRAMSARFVVEKRLFAEDFSIYLVRGPRKLPVVGPDGESLRFPSRGDAVEALARMPAPSAPE
jgi:hypothetical protein